MLNIKLFALMLLVFIYKSTKGIPIGPRDGIEVPPPEVVNF